MHLQEKGSGSVQVQEFDKVILGSGPYRDPVTPPIPGLRGFKGKVMHAKDFRHKDIFKGKRVLIYGE